MFLSSKEKEKISPGPNQKEQVTYKGKVIRLQVYLPFAKPELGRQWEAIHRLAGSQARCHPPVQLTEYSWVCKFHRKDKPHTPSEEKAQVKKWMNSNRNLKIGEIRQHSGEPRELLHLNSNKVLGMCNVSHKEEYLKKRHSAKKTWYIVLEVLNYLSKIWKLGWWKMKGVKASWSPTCFQWKQA